MDALETDSIIACNIVKKLFKHINLWIPKTNISMFEKGIIKSMLTEKVLNGINNCIIFVYNKYPNDVKVLIDDIEVELKKRKRHV